MVVSVSVPAVLIEQLNCMADHRGWNRSQAITEAIRDFVDASKRVEFSRISVATPAGSQDQWQESLQPFSSFDKQRSNSGAHFHFVSGDLDGPFEVISIFAGSWSHIRRGSCLLNDPDFFRVECG